MVGRLDCTVVRMVRIGKPGKLITDLVKKSSAGRLWICLCMPVPVYMLLMKCHDARAPLCLYLCVFIQDLYMRGSTATRARM